MQLKSARKPRATKAAEAATEAPVAENLLPAIVPPAPEAITPSDADIAAPGESFASEAPGEAADSSPVYRTAARDAETVMRAATNFAQYSDRDTAYLAFFGSVMRPLGHSATLAEIHNAGKPAPGNSARRSNPFYTGSAKATDAGAINRLIKAGYLTASESGNRLTATDKAKATAAYLKH